jgi:hypothetical protein
MWVVAFLLLAQPGNPYLAQGRALAFELKFAEAVEQLKVARRVPGAPLEERLEVLELLATCLVAEGARDGAEEAYAELLTLRPEHELDEGTSPKVSELFTQVKRRLYPGDSVGLFPLAGRDDEALVRVVDPYRRAAAFVLVTREDGGAWGSRPVPRTDDGVRVSLEVRPGHALELYLEARAADGRVLASLGTDAEPQRRAVALVGPQLVSRATPRLERSPAWVMTGLAVTAAVAGGLFQWQSLEAAARARGAGPPGDWADTARAEHQLAVTDAALATGFFIGAGVAAATGAALFAW